MFSLSPTDGLAIGFCLTVGDPSIEPGGRAAASSPVSWDTVAVLVAVPVPPPADAPLRGALQKAGTEKPQSYGAAQKDR